jgi:hypothetical protein
MTVFSPFRQSPRAAGLGDTQETGNRTCPDNLGFYSRLFTVPEKDGSIRPVINLRPLNRFITAPKFRMASVSTMAKMIQDGDWATSIDLKDAFFHVPIHRLHMWFLRFIWRGTSYQFRSCPFGLLPAPSTFTRLTRPILHWYRLQGMRVIFFLDDLLILTRSLINLKKSDLTPSQSFQHLGLLWNSAKMTVSLPPEKVSDLRDSVALHFLDKANFACIAIPRGHLQCHPI